MLTYLADKFRQPWKDDEDSPKNPKNQKVCLACRLVSGIGIIGGGGYIAYESLKRKSPFQRYLMLGVASGKPENDFLPFKTSGSLQFSQPQNLIQ